jgi:hypothetical protein
MIGIKKKYYDLERGIGMKKSIIRDLIIFLSGAAIGALIANKLVKNEYEEDYKDPVSEMSDEAWERRCREVYDTTTDEDPVVTTETKLIKRKPGSERIAYDKVYPFKRNEEDTVVTDTNPPSIITSEQFADEHLDFDKVTLYYYDEDDTLTNENEEIISDPALLIGEEALVKFGENPYDDDTVYVRNERFGADYEIIRLHLNYRVTILGISEDPPKRVRRRTSNPNMEEES